MEQKDLSEQAWTVASYLESAATKFDEIAKDWEGLNPQMVLTFKRQAEHARELAAMFKEAENVTLS